MRRQADRFMAEIERATRLDDAYHAAMRLPASPYNRLLREGINFFSELKRSEEHTSELQSQSNLVCRLLLEKKKKWLSQPLGLSQPAEHYLFHDEKDFPWSYECA